ncbi:MAG: hypothetical protein WA057_03930 [Candidatus Magasanikiibacteriota bacterium]
MSVERKISRLNLSEADHKGNEKELDKGEMFLISVLIEGGFIENKQWTIAGLPLLDFVVYVLNDKGEREKKVVKIKILNVNLSRICIVENSVNHQKKQISVNRLINSLEK